LRRPGGYRFCCSDAIIPRGKVFAVDASGTIYTWDICAASSCCPDVEPELMTKPPNVNDLLDEFDCRWRLAESEDGRQVLLVCIYGKEMGSYDETTGYRRRMFANTAGSHDKGVCACTSETWTS
jgi:hypothetical protein